MYRNAFFLVIFVVTASLKVAPAAEPNIPVKEFPLSDVRILDSPFKDNMERNAKYLLELDPDRLLHNTRKYAGLEPKGELYGGWEARGIAGHSLGHYLTALSLQYAATGDKRFKERLDYIVAEMAECQKRYGDGYIGALPPKELEAMRDFKKGIVRPESAFTFVGGAWVPWYTQHKVLQGLVDAWTLGQDKQAKDVALGLADWTYDITKGLNPQQTQAMLQVEHGGMLDTLVQIYKLTGDKKYLDASKKFYHHEIFDPLLAGRDELNGKHANTQIPKIIGEARDYEVTGDADGRKISEFFWDTVVHNRSWVIGGNSDHEHFFPVGEAAQHLGPVTAESCNTYNMLKLTEHLFSWNPTVERADFYERGLYNHILGSQDPENGMFTYFMSFKPGHFRTYSTPFDSFWCCVGSGMENHTKYGEAIYFHTADTLIVNLFIPSMLRWQEKGVILKQTTDFPNADTTELTIESDPTAPFAIRFRCPGWAAAPLTFELNGEPLQVDGKPGQYAEIKHEWKKGDTLKVTIPMDLQYETLEGDNNKIAFLYGPIVLAGDFGPVPRTNSFPYAGDQGENFNVPGTDVPVLIRRGTDEDLLASIKRVPGNELAFRTEGIGRPEDFTMKPFYRMDYDYYNVYWDVVSAGEWTQREAELTAEKERRKLEEARIVDEIRFGEQQPEIDHKVRTGNSRTGDFQDRKWRDATEGGFIEFEMKVLPDTPQVLRCTYWGDDVGRNFDIKVNGEVIATQALERKKPGEFVDVEYPIPAKFTSGKQAITVRFEPKSGSIAGGFFGVAVLKAND